MLDLDSLAEKRASTLRPAHLMRRNREQVDTPGLHVHRDTAQRLHGIAEKEGTQRGSYAGALGYFSYNGNLDSCITLRTAMLKDGIVYIQAGGGIVADSVPAAEYQESINKASALFKAIRLAEMLVR